MSSGSDVMTVVAARALSNHDVCFVGIGAPSAACNVARITHAPDITLIYESGTIGAAPSMLPLSIGDGELVETALMTVSVPEVFSYWLQGGRIDIGFLGAAQLDRFGNINTTVIGTYEEPTVRLPGAGGAPEIAAHCGQVYVITPHSPRNLVEKVDFVTSLGSGRSGVERELLGITTAGVSLVVTDLAILEPEEDTNELVVVSLHEGVSRNDVRIATGWPVRFAANIRTTPPPTSAELDALRTLERTSSR